MRAPIAFISHGGEEDLPFCGRLYQELVDNGVRPLMDKKDFQLGDDLIKRIFDEGIAESDAVLFVLSPESVDRPFVREELSVAVVQKLRRRTRLIPILLRGLPDDRVPAALAATLWTRADDEDQAASVALEISTVLHGDRPSNPQVAAAPAWTSVALSDRRQLEAQDEVLFINACKLRLAQSHSLIRVNDIVEYAKTQGLTEEDVRTAIAIFHRHYYIEPPIPRGGLLPTSIQLTTFGLEGYMMRYEAERFARAFERSIAAIVNQKISNTIDLATAVDESSTAVLELIIDKLEGERELIVVRSLGGPTKWSARESLVRRLSRP